MCDTMGMTGPGGAFFAKNSDRSPNEVQALEFRPARTNPPGKIRLTYTDIEEASRTYAILISRPVWMWGAEMGVNEKGVCIGNEAVFTKGPYGKTGRTGMDMLRLALERSASAEEALHCITALLEHGQGGDCGYDHPFYYDNSFLIMDFSSLYILETAGKEWACRSLPRGSISNTLCLKASDDQSAQSRAVKNGFAKQFREPVFSFFSGSARRRMLTGTCIKNASGIFDMIRGLRAHRDDGGPGPLTRAGVDSPCMHAGGLIGDHTTASMAVELSKDKIIVWATGSSTPCISLFKPWLFADVPARTKADGPVFPAGEEGLEQSTAYWRKREDFHRAVIGRTLPSGYYAERDALEAAWFALSRNAGPEAMKEISRRAALEEEAFFAKWKKELPALTEKSLRGKKTFLRYWKKKNAALAVPARAPCTGG